MQLFFAGASFSYPLAWTFFRELVGMTERKPSKTSGTIGCLVGLPVVALLIIICGYLISQFINLASNALQWFGGILKEWGSALEGL